MFEIATREKYRFPYNGSISVEDLWDLTPSQLNTIFKKLSAEIKQFSEDSLLSKKSLDEELLMRKIDIVKHVFEYKQNEAEERKKDASNKEKKQRLRALIAEKQDAELKDMSIEDLKKMLNELGD